MPSKLFLATDSDSVVPKMESAIKEVSSCESEYVVFLVRNKGMSQLDENMWYYGYETRACLNTIRLTGAGKSSSGDACLPRPATRCALQAGLTFDLIGNNGALREGKRLQAQFNTDAIAGAVIKVSLFPIPLIAACYETNYRNWEKTSQGLSAKFPLRVIALQMRFFSFFQSRRKR